MIPSKIQDRLERYEREGIIDVMGERQTDGTHVLAISFSPDVPKDGYDALHVTLKNAPNFEFVGALDGAHRYKFTGPMRYASDGGTEERTE